jgi:hypothetical protein
MPAHKALAAQGTVTRAEASAAPERLAENIESAKKTLAHTTLRFRVNGYDLELPLETDKAVFDTVSLNTKFPAVFELLTNDAITVTVDGREVLPNTETQVQVDKILAGTYISVTASDGKNTRTVFIRTLNANIPAMIVRGESPHEGYYYLSIPTMPVALKLDRTGNIVYYLSRSPVQGVGCTR